MKDYNKKIIDGTWVTSPEDKDVQVKIKPFSVFSMIKLPNEKDFDTEKFWAVFNFVVLDWKGIHSDGKKLDCDEDNKKFVFDFDQDFALWVVNQATEMRQKVISNEEIKN